MKKHSYPFRNRMRHHWRFGYPFRILAVLREKVSMAELKRRYPEAK